MNLQSAKILTVLGILFLITGCSKYKEEVNNTPFSSCEEKLTGLILDSNFTYHDWSTFTSNGEKLVSFSGLSKPIFNSLWRNIYDPNVGDESFNFTIYFKYYTSPAIGWSIYNVSYDRQSLRNVLGPSWAFQVSPNLSEGLCRNS